MVRQLKKDYPKYSLSILAERLCLSVPSIRAKVKSLGLKKDGRFIIRDKEFTSEQVQALCERCKDETFKDVATSVGLPPQNLVEFFKRHGYYNGIIAYRQKISLETNERKRKQGARITPSIRQENITTTRQRVPYGEVYWVPESSHIGAYRVVEKGDAFDESHYNEGRYFNSEDDALKYSRLLVLNSR